MKYLRCSKPTPCARSQLEREHGKVRTLNSQKRQITLVDGQQIGYDACLLASGAKALRPDIPGADLPGVFTACARGWMPHSCSTQPNPASRR